MFDLPMMLWRIARMLQSGYRPGVACAHAWQCYRPGKLQKCIWVVVFGVLLLSAIDYVSR